MASGDGELGIPKGVVEKFASWGAARSRTWGAGQASGL